MQPQRRSVLHLLLVGLTAGACTEQTAPTAIPDGVNAAVTAAAGPNQEKVRIKQLQLSSNTLRIDGPSVNVAMSIGNTGPAISPGVIVSAIITQGASLRRAGRSPTQCTPNPDDAGKLPTGTCEMTFAASASNSAAGSGPGLVAGAATLTVQVIQVGTASSVELATKSVLVNLVAKPAISALSLASTTLTIEGPAAKYTATLQNPAGSLQNVSLQGWVIQGLTRRAAGGTLVTCSSPGVLPTGTCTMSSFASASHNGVFTEVFAPGPATFLLYLNQSSGGATTLLDSALIPITLTEPIITLLTLASPEVEINGPLGNYTVQVANDGVPLSDVLLQGELVQVQPDGPGKTKQVAVQAGGTLVTCGGAPGSLPTGTCTVQFGISASTSASGTGTLQPGPATFKLHLYKSPPNAPLFEWDVESTPVVLTSPTPILTSVVPTSTDVIINTPVELVTKYVATIDNPGVKRFTVLLSAEVKQSTGASRGAGGSNVSCGGNLTLGVLPPGPCSETRPISAFNQTPGNGTLVPGPATLEVSLLWFDGSKTILLDKKSVGITLVEGVTVTNVTVPTTDVPPGSAMNYSITINNPFNTTLSNVRVAAFVDQGGIVGSTAGETLLNCTPTAGQLPPVTSGTCTISSTFTVQTAPAWQLGDATLRLQLKQGNAIWDEKSVAIKIVGFQ